MKSQFNLKIEGWCLLIRRVLLNALLGSVVLGGITLAVCWLIDWRTLYQIGLGLMMAGVLSISLGLLSTVGTWNNRGNFNYQYSRSVSHQKIGERTSQDIHDLFGSNAFMITTLLAGVILILVGNLLQT